MIITKAKATRRPTSSESAAEASRKKFYAVLKHAKKLKSGVWTTQSGLKVKGFDMVKSSSSFLCRHAQKTLLSMVLEGKPKFEIYKFLRSLRQEVLRGEWQLVDICVPTVLSQDLDSYHKTMPGHVKAARIGAERYGDFFKRGDTVFTAPFLPRSRETNVIGFFDPLEAEQDYDLPKIDYLEVIDKQIKKKVDLILKTLGMSWEEAISGRTQLSLLDYGLGGL